jgi:hypothetical protein
MTGFMCYPEEGQSPCQRVRSLPASRNASACHEIGAAMPGEASGRFAGIRLTPRATAAEAPIGIVDATRPYRGLYADGLALSEVSDGSRQ